jgi:hypothetical protein
MQEVDRMLQKASRRRVTAAMAVLAALVVAACGSASGDSTTTSTSSTTTTTPSATSLLVGRWERTGGDFSILEGMVVEVDELATEGEIVSVPINPYRFVIGDVKWSALTEVGNGRIRINDLSREADTGLPSMVTGVITVTEDGTMLEITFPSTGTSQVWTRIP